MKMILEIFISDMHKDVREMNEMYSRSSKKAFLLSWERIRTFLYIDNVYRNHVVCSYFFQVEEHATLFSN